MKIEIRLFATLKDKLNGKNKIIISVDEPATVADLLVAVGAQMPELAPALGSVVVAVNKEFAFGETAVSADDEIALFPPVSGGSELPHPTYFSLSSKPVDINAIHAKLTRPDVGAIISFSGSVRGETARDGLPTKTLSLEYEAYSGMAEQKMAQIAHEIWERWPLVKGVAIVQRIGKLGVGDSTTFVACAAGHRDQGAFQAARYGIDRLKEIVPVWKKEIGEDESVWVEGDYRPSEGDTAQ